MKVFIYLFLLSCSYSFSKNYVVVTSEDTLLGGDKEHVETFLESVNTNIEILYLGKFTNLKDLKISNHLSDSDLISGIIINSDSSSSVMNLSWNNKRKSLKGGELAEKIYQNIPKDKIGEQFFVVNCSCKTAKKRLFGKNFDTLFKEKLISHYKSSLPSLEKISVFSFESSPSRKVLGAQLIEGKKYDPFEQFLYKSVSSTAIEKFFKSPIKKVLNWDFLIVQQNPFKAYFFLNLMHYISDAVIGLPGILPELTTLTLHLWASYNGLTQGAVATIETFNLKSGENVKEKSSIKRLFENHLSTVHCKNRLKE